MASTKKNKLTKEQFENLNNRINNIINIILNQKYNFDDNNILKYNELNTIVFRNRNMIYNTNPTCNCQLSIIGGFYNIFYIYKHSLNLEDYEKKTFLEIIENLNNNIKDFLTFELYMNNDYISYELKDIILKMDKTIYISVNYNYYNAFIEYFFLKCLNFQQQGILLYKKLLLIDVKDHFYNILINTNLGKYITLNAPYESTNGSSMRLILIHIEEYKKDNDLMSSYSTSLTLKQHLLEIFENPNNDE